MTREGRFLAELPLVDRVIRWVCARRCLRGADAEDFGSIVKTRLVENDYEVFAQFEGRSSLKTYLYIVVNRLYLDFQIQRYGKWRTSVEARRLGPVAERLECLIDRDGLTVSEACGILATDPRVGESRDALEELCSRLPQRSRRRERAAMAVSEEARPASWELEQRERQALAQRAFAAVRRSFARLPPRDSLFLQLHFANGLTFAQVAKSLDYDQKAIYR